MTTWSGAVGKHADRLEFAADEEDGTSLDEKQWFRLTRASLEHPDQKVEEEIDLGPFEGKRIKVDGEYEHDWILNAAIALPDTR